MTFFSPRTISVPLIERRPHPRCGRWPPHALKRITGRSIQLVVLACVLLNAVLTSRLCAQSGAQNLSTDEAAVLFLENGRLQRGNFDNIHRTSTFPQTPALPAPDPATLAPPATVPPPPPPGDLAGPALEDTAEPPAPPQPDTAIGAVPEFDSQVAPFVPTIPQDVYDLALEALNMPFDGPAQEIPKVGVSYVPFAAFAIEPAKPRSQMRFRIDSARRINQPDRLEYLWKRIGGGGPSQPEHRLDYQSLSLYSETANDRGSGFMQIPIIWLDPSANDNTASIGNMLVGTKAILADGEGFFWFPSVVPEDHFYLSMYFATEISLNPLFADRGLTHGHTTLSPGLLASYELSPETVFQSEFKLHIPLGGTNGFAGNVLEYGTGVSHVLYSSIIDSPDCKHFAIMGTLEFEFLSFLSGGQTNSSTGETEFVDGITTCTIHSGLRCALNNRVDVGASAGFNLTSSRHYSSLGRFEIRWHW